MDPDNNDPRHAGTAGGLYTHLSGGIPDMARIRPKDRAAVLDALQGGVTPRQGIQHIQVGRLEETEAIVKDIENIEQGGSAIRIIQASYGSGKLLPLDTPVLAEDGWKPNGELRVGDRIYTREGNLTEVTGIFPEDDVEEWEIVLGDGRAMKCCKDHLWFVLRRDSEGEEERVMSVSDMLEAPLVVGISESGEEPIPGEDGYRYHFPTVLPPQMPKRDDLPVPPYAAGVVAACGTLAEDGRIALSRCPRHAAEEAAKDLSAAGFETSVDTDRIGVRSLVMPDMPGALADIAEEGDLPGCYLMASPTQRGTALQGVLDARCLVVRGKAAASLDSRRMAETTLDLARSLGLVARESLPSGADSPVDGTHQVLVWGADLPGVLRDPVRRAEAARGRAQGRSESVPVVEIRKTGGRSDMQCISVADESHSYVIRDYVPSHNTFFLTLTKTVALRRNFVVMSTDFSPDRRLYSTSKKALETYRALVRSMSTMSHPDGGALEELLNALDEKIEVRDAEFLSQTRRLVCGMDAVTVINYWHQSKHPETRAEENAAFHVQDLCLRWFSGEMTPEQRREFGLSETIGDAQAYDALKLIAHLAHCAGYAGTLVEYDECVNLYKINNSISRDKNYEQILRIFNEAKQGDAQYIGFIFGGTPEFVSDPRRGLFSYEALQSRLMPNRFRDRSKDVDTSGPIIDLAPLSQEDLLVLLGNITNVEAMGKREDWLVTDDDMRRFLQLYFNALGADYYRTPREIIRAFVSLLSMLRDNPDMTVDDALSQVEVKEERKESGLGAVTRKAVEAAGSDGDDGDDDDDFGF